MIRRILISCVLLEIVIFARPNTGVAQITAKVVAKKVTAKYSSTNNGEIGTLNELSCSCNLPCEKKQEVGGTTNSNNELACVKKAAERTDGLRGTSLSVKIGAITGGANAIASSSRSSGAVGAFVGGATDTIVRAYGGVAAINHLKPIVNQQSHHSTNP